MQTILVDPQLSDSQAFEWSWGFDRAFGAQNKAVRSALDDAAPHIATYWRPPSVDPAITTSVTSNHLLVALAVLIVCVFTIAAMHVRGRTLARLLVALSALASATLSIGAGLGASLLLGLRFTSITQVLPFILLGVAIDDAMLLVQSLEEVGAQSSGQLLPVRTSTCLVGGAHATSLFLLPNANAACWCGYYKSVCNALCHGCLS